ncbi:hypothetical protein EMPS_00233 [Entomortierella parvispora]|uniref:Uncharacterized protein n=1 Tax=Entomortierella parvispora TaxID=205924 RepID=A0A9P3H0J7_9FUNG|nr:hypothetical protein EMPS_00233 [Entomortierella parvispora]
MSSGHIHFVTPTNRWIGSVPLSTIDPLTLEPLSTYLRPGSSSASTQGQNESTLASNTEDDEYKDRRTNLSGQPVSLILARLQTTPQGCSCGCTVPAPPKHSDYYHAQHLLQLIFQTQRIRSRALRAHLPQYFEPPLPEEEPGGSNLPLNPPEITSAVPTSTDQNRAIPSTTLPIEPVLQGTGNTEPRPPLAKPQVPRYVHSLIQNRTFKNPLTNTEVEGDPMFFAVLEPGCGGWWFEPWAMVIRPAGEITGIDPRFRHYPQQSQHRDHYQQSQSAASEAANEGTSEKTPEMILEEKEQRKERWRQARLVTLEAEAEHELEWRRWRRSIILAPRSGTTSSSSSSCRKRRPHSRTSGLMEGVASESWKRSSCPRLMRYKLGKDIAVLEPSERGLRLPRQVKMTENRNHAAEGSHFDGKVMLSAAEDPSEDTRLTSEIHTSATLDQVEPEDFRQYQSRSKTELKIEDKDGKSIPSALGQKRGLKSISRRQSIAVHRKELGTMPWWDPEPQPLKIPKTGFSPFAISTLPAPVAKRFGGVSMYQPPEPPLSSSSSSQTSTSDAIEEKEKTPEENCDTDGCKWVPVQPGDRVAVMIGTSKDFMLFPSFQRLLFRHLSREDFEDRAGRVGVIPYPASLAFATQPRGSGGRQSRGGETASQGPSTMNLNQRRRSAEDGPVEQEVNRDNYGQPRSEDLGEETPSRSWLPWRRSTGATGTRATTSVSVPVGRVAMERSPVESEDGRPDARFDRTVDVSENADSIESDTTSALDCGEKTKGENRAPSTHSDENDHETQLGLYLETFEREDYDSSEYSFCSSSDENDDISNLDINTDYDFSDVSDSSEDEDGDELGRQEGVAPSSSCFWKRLLCCCSSSSGVTRERSRRSRASQRRRARREQWRQRRQLRYLQQESPVVLRYLPASVQRRMSPEGVVRCWQLSEFCRFYLTILMAIALMGAIVYGAIHAESMPPKGPISAAASSPGIKNRHSQAWGTGEVQRLVNAVNSDGSSSSTLMGHIPVEAAPRKHEKDQTLLSRRRICTRKNKIARR